MSIRKERFDYPAKLQNIFCLLSVSGKWNVVGSSNLRGLLYNSDYDLSEQLKNGYDVGDALRKLFIHKFEKAHKLPSVYFTDFKCGEDAQGEPLRWNLKTLQLNRNKGMTFQEALHSGGIIKLDCVAYLNGRFEEVTEVYVLKGKSSTVPPKKNLITELKKSQSEYLEEGNYWKALKRQFSILIAENNHQKSSALLRFFNSPIGILAKSVSELDTILMVLEQSFKPPNLEEVKNNLQLVKWRLSNINSLYSRRIDGICRLNSKKTILNCIATLREDIFRVVNQKAKSFNY
jgi:hypothetical protein